MMFLLDTHALLWFLTDDPKMPKNVKSVIETAENIRVSIGTFWEIAIKSSIGKLALPVSVTTLMGDCEELGFLILPIEAPHLERLKELPKIHGDPFDRLLICQAQAENLKLVTADENIAKYDVKTLWRA